MKNKGTAAVLALLLGGIGIHRFYLGQSGLGLIYLLLCWTFVPAIIALIDFVVFLAMSEASFNAKYNSSATQVRVAPQVGQNVAEELGKLHQLKENGALTEQEFAERKAKLLR